MKRVAALLTIVLLALPLTAAAQTAKPPEPPESVDDLKGPIRDYVIEANGITRGLCKEALEARDDAKLQKILDDVEGMFRKQATETVALLQKVREESSLLDEMTALYNPPYPRSGIDKQWADLRAAKRKYAQAVARSTVLEQVRERVRGCVGIAVNSIRQPGVTAATGTGAGSGTGVGTTGRAAELCQSQAGPLGCTGSFSGMYQGECGDGSGPPSRDASPGSITFFADGTVTLRLQGGTSALNGRVDSTGRVSILEEGLHRADIGDGFSQRWEGRFSVQPAPGGGSRVVGGGTYESRLKGPQGELQNACKGTFTLSGPPS